MSTEKFDFAALERQLKLVVDKCNSGDYTEEEIKEEAKAALHMLPRYKRIDEVVEQIREALHASGSFTVEYEQGFHSVGGINGWMEHIPTGRRTITIEVQR